MIATAANRTPTLTSCSRLPGPAARTIEPNSAIVAVSPYGARTRGAEAAAVSRCSSCASFASGEPGRRQRVFE
jgi:hypothetical protein